MKSCTNQPAESEKDCEDDLRQEQDDGEEISQNQKHSKPGSEVKTADLLMWCPDLHLDQEDRIALIRNKWLSDKHIYAAQILLKKQFAHIGGLQPPTLSLTGQWQVMSSEGIQISHTGNHWLCVSTIGCPGTPSIFMIA